MGKEKLIKMKNYFVAGLIGLSVGFAGALSFYRYTEKPCPVPVIPTCPKCPPNSIDINKLKDFRGKFIINQTYEVNSDSVSRELIKKDFEDALKNLKISRCK